MTSGSIPALLDRLERNGQVHRRPHPSGRRSVTLALTESGTVAVEAIRSAYLSAFADLFSGDELVQATEVLTRIGGSRNGLTLRESDNHH